MHRASVEALRQSPWLSTRSPTERQIRSMKFSDGFWLMRAGVGAVTGGTATAHPHAA
jgi:hypothetical protein